MRDKLLVEETLLRVKHLNSEMSEPLKDAFGVNATPVVFAGGVFSTLTEWESGGSIANKLGLTDGLATKLAQRGQEVWEIELTGGPTQDCDTCPNYTYQDLVDFYWPALIGGVEAYSGKNMIHYVGHSNGCRVALSALNEYSASGILGAGYYYDVDSGSFVSSNLSADVVEKFVGYACPAVLNDESLFVDAVRFEHFGFFGSPFGDYAIAKLRDDETNHLTIREFIGAMPWLGEDGLSALLLRLYSGGAKISLNLMEFYSDLANNDSSTLNLSGVNVSTLHLVATSPDDFIVPFEDAAEINSSTDSIPDSSKNVSNIESIRILGIPIFVDSSDHEAMIVKKHSEIIEVLDNE